MQALVYSLQITRRSMCLTNSVATSSPVAGRAGKGIHGGVRMRGFPSPPLRVLPGMTKREQAPGRSGVLRVTMHEAQVVGLERGHEDLAPLDHGDGFFGPALPHAVEKARVQFQEFGDGRILAP